MPRITVTVSAEVAAKTAFVRAHMTRDRSDSALVNRALIEYLDKFDDPPKGEIVKVIDR